MKLKRFLIKIKNRLPRIFMSIYAIFLGVMAFSGFQELGVAWGFQEENVIFMFIGGISGLYVTIATWYPRKVIVGLEKEPKAKNYGE